MGDLTQYYRSFLNSPYQNANFMFNGGSKYRTLQRGGAINRFGAPLSGNPNPNVLFGSPTGGATGYLSKNRSPEFVSGAYSSNIRGSGNNIIGIRSNHMRSDPRYFGKSGIDFKGQGKKRGQGQRGGSILMDNFINPQNYHSTSMTAMGSRIY